jgi:hypothetical protein
MIVYDHSVGLSANYSQRYKKKECQHKMYWHFLYKRNNKETN